MSVNREKIKYVPGMYAKKRPSAEQMANAYFSDWQQRQVKRVGRPVEQHHAICISRKIGVGAVELADMLAERLEFRVVDREMIEYIAENGKLSEKTVAYYDERYADKIDEFMSFLFREKSFTMSDYTRRLVSAIYAMADDGPTIFVGRGAHLVLPRESVLAIRLIASKSYRIYRLARVLDVSPDLAVMELEELDNLQRKFFKKAYNVKDASPYEFDLVLNLDHLRTLSCAADIIQKAYECKF